MNANDIFNYKKSLILLLGELENDILEQILFESQILHFDSGQYIFHQGDIENCLYIVLSGRFRVINNNINGPIVLGDVSIGEPIGEISLFTNEPRTASVAALRKSIVLKLNFNTYLSLIKKNPDFAITLTKIVINRLQRNSFQKK